MIKKNLCVANGAYTKDGQEKTRWVTVGHLHESQDGKEYITLDRHINLAGLEHKEGETRVFANLFSVQSDRQSSSGGQRTPPARGGDDIPY